MGALVRIVFPLIGYLCVGTVITAAAGYGYLRNANKLDDERMFKIVALLHGVDLEEVAEAQRMGVDEIPVEELSYEAKQQQYQIAALQIQAKRADLDDDLEEFAHRQRSVDIANNRYQLLRDDVEQYLKTEQERAEEEGLVSVGEHMKGLDAKKQAKPLLLEMIKDNRIDEVIRLLNRMTSGRRKEILRTFVTEEEIAILYRIQNHIMAGDPVKPFINSKIQDLQQLKQRDR